ncbi:unnamed protein product [Auanema sp. JU1783]|nr:unnamed protein product [Auanema sp. JU1783]
MSGTALNFLRQFSSKNSLPRTVVVCANGTVASWHPPAQFPYEHSRPVEFKPLKDRSEEKSILSSTVKQQRQASYSPKNVDLKEIFYTDKNEWYTRNFLLALEHFPVYTVGIRSKLYSIEEELRLKSLGADFFRTSRGGLITFHGPGQLVLYPIFNLHAISPKKHGVRTFVSSIEQVIITSARNDFGIENVGTTEHTGVWVDGMRKLAAIGINVSHGVTHHGLALNCNTDLTWFDNIIGCGIEGVETTSLSKECSRDINPEDALNSMVTSFTQIFDCSVIDY